MIPKYLTQENLDALKKYKYAAEDHSILKKLFMGRYWDFVVSLFPDWFAPNLMTFLGFLCLFSNFAIATYYCPGVTDCVVPNWIFIWTAVSLFLYQTLDNIDGKQARLTGSSSALGELFDHGCDSLFLLFTGMPFFLAVRSDKWLSFLYLTQGIVAFFWTHWEEYHTGKMIMGVIANPTEAQFVIMGFFLVAGIYGPEVYSYKLHEVLPAAAIKSLNGHEVLNWELTWVVHFCIWGMLAPVLIHLWWSAQSAAREKKQGFFDPILRILPQVIQIIAMVTWIHYSKYDILEKQTHLVLSLHGVLFSFMCDEILLARICDFNFKWYNPINIIPIIGALNVALFKTPLIPEEYALPILFGVMMIVYVWFILSVIDSFTTYLKIRVFVITPKPKPKNH